MSHRIQRLLWAGTRLLVGFTAIACGAPPEDDAPRTGEVQQPAIREPASVRVDEALAKLGGTRADIISLDPASLWDGRRDAWEDEFPDLGEDPADWQQPPIRRRFGFQWLRSYARNSSVAFFEKNDFVDAGNGTKKLKLLRESSDAVHRAELQLGAAGFDLCPEKFFSDQINNGATGLAECSGTLIDRNLVLTAAHCIRNLGTNNLKHGSLDNVRVAFNYLFADPGRIVSAGQGQNDPRELRFVPNRDIFRIREVLTINVNTVDMAILQLLDEAGNPIDSVDPRYVPVPLWKSAIAPVPHKVYRPGAAIGVGARLPQKISPSRSIGWGTDPEFLGLNINADIFGGNSGGGVYDVETGALVGLVHAEFEHRLFVTCPPPPAPANLWPLCPRASTCSTDADCLQGTACDSNTHRCVVPGIVQAEPFVLSRVPEFTFVGNTAQSRGCGQWMSQKWPDTHKQAFLNWVTQNFTVQSAAIDVGLTPQQDALAVSLQAVRMLACEPANSTQPFAVAVDNAIDRAIALRQQSIAAGSDKCQGERIFSFCPTAVVVGARPTPVQGRPFETSLSHAQAASILRESRLCKGPVAGERLDRWTRLPEIRLEHGREATYYGTTLSGNDYLEVDHTISGTPDALYRIQVDDWTIVYADTFSGGADLGVGPGNPGTDFNTVLFIAEAADDTATDPLLQPSAWVEPLAFNDSMCSVGASDVNFQQQSLLLFGLQPGKKYVLGVTGAGDQRGNFNLHVQAVPGPRQGRLLFHQQATRTVVENGVTLDIFEARPFVPSASEQKCVNGISSDEPFDPECMYSTQAPLGPTKKCQRTDSGEFGFVGVSCPEFTGQDFRFRIGARSSLLGPYDDDPVGQFWEGQVRHVDDGYVCADDSKFIIDSSPFPPILLDDFSSEIGSVGQTAVENTQAFISSGAGVRVFYAHQYQIFLNWQNLGFTLKLPPEAAHSFGP